VSGRGVETLAQLPAARSMAVSDSTPGQRCNTLYRAAVTMSKETPDGDSGGEGGELTTFLLLLVPAGLIFLICSAVIGLSDVAASAAAMVGALTTAAGVSFFKSRANARPMLASDQASIVEMMALCRRLGAGLFGEVPVAKNPRRLHRPVVNPTGSGALLAAVEHGRFVQVHAAQDPNYGVELRLTLAADGGRWWPRSTQGEVDPTRTFWSTPPVAIGDYAFGRRVRAYGPDDYVLAAMTFKIRQAILEGMTDSWSNVELRMDPAIIRLTSRPWLDVRVPDQSLAANLRVTISTYADVLGQLSLAAEAVLPGLLDNAASDPVPGVRLRSVELLVSKHSDQESTRRLCNAALGDSDPGVRLAAAIFVRGESGWATLTAIVEAESQSPDLRLKAAKHLVALYPEDRSWPEIERVLLSAETALRGSIIRAMAGSQSGWIVPRLCALAKRCPPDVCEVIIESLWKNPQTCIEDALVALLARPELPVLQAAIRALGEVGTIRAIAPLLDLAQNDRLGDAVRAALAKIQDRTHAGEAGRLSLETASVQAGALSLTAGEGSIEVAHPIKSRPH
jgi:hypothetical protein